MDSSQLDGYFSRARNWYDTRYHSPISERAFILLMAVALVVSAFTLMIVYASIGSGGGRVPIYLTVEDADFKRIELIRLRQGKEELDRSIARYLVSNYVTERESYSYDRATMQRQFRIVTGQTDNSVLGSYTQEMNQQNPNGRLKRYGREATLDVEIESVRFTSDADPGQRNATVRYATLEWRAGSVTRRSHEAKVTFAMPRLHLDEETLTVLAKDSEDAAAEPLDGSVPFSVLAYTNRSGGAADANAK